MTSTDSGADPTGPQPVPDSGPTGDRPAPEHPFTLAVDIGGTGLKASVLDAAGAMVADRVKILTPYPLPPEKLVASLARLVAPLPTADRAAVGFPGMVRGGVVLPAPHFVTVGGPGTEVDHHLVEQWARFDLAAALTAEFGVPTKAANDADIQGAAVVRGEGSSSWSPWAPASAPGCSTTASSCPTWRSPISRSGRARPTTSSSARRPARRWATALEQAGHEGHRQHAGPHPLRPPLPRRGNSRRVLRTHLPDDVTVVDNTAGILGGFRLWEPRHAGSGGS